MIHRVFLLKIAMCWSVTENHWSTDCVPDSFVLVTSIFSSAHASIVSQPLSVGWNNLVGTIRNKQFHRYPVRPGYQAILFLLILTYFYPTTRYEMSWSCECRGLLLLFTGVGETREITFCCQVHGWYTDWNPKRWTSGFDHNDPCPSVPSETKWNGCLTIYSNVYVCVHAAWCAIIIQGIHKILLLWENYFIVKFVITTNLFWGSLAGETILDFGHPWCLLECSTSIVQ